MKDDTRRSDLFTVCGDPVYWLIFMDTSASYVFRCMQSKVSNTVSFIISINQSINQVLINLSLFGF